MLIISCAVLVATLAGCREPPLLAPDIEATVEARAQALAKEMPESTAEALPSTPAFIATPAPVPATYLIESAVVEFTGGGHGLVQTSFSVTVKNAGELRGVEPVRIELAVDDDDPEPAGIIDPLVPGETLSFILSRGLVPGHHQVTFIVEGSERVLNLDAKAADIALTVLGHAIAGNGAITLEVRVTNEGDLIADSVALSADWVSRADDTSGADASSGSTEATVIKRLAPGDSQTVELPVEIPTGSYAFTVSAETESIEAFQDNNSVDTTVAVDYVALVASVGLVRHVGYERDGAGIVEVEFQVANKGVAESGELLVGVACADPGCSQSLTLDSLQPGHSADGLLRVAVPQGEVEALVFAGGLDEGYLWGESNVRKVMVNVAERTTSSPARDRETVVVGGYWSDGTANVEVTPSLDRAKGLWTTVRCAQAIEPAGSCQEQTLLWPSNGPEPSAETLIMRLPMGAVYVLVFDYGGNETVFEVAVPERILGVERDVWECFSDTSKVGTEWERYLGIGCAGWYQETTTKWDQDVPVRLWVNPAGDKKYIEILDRVLAKLSSVLKLQVERVPARQDANFVAHVGVGGANAHGIDLGCFPGCVGSWPIEDGVIRSGIIVVFPLDWESDSQIEEEILRDALDSLLEIRNRHLDQTSVMGNYEVVDARYIHRMDEALFGLLYHPLVRPGMTMDEVRGLVALRDELLDRPEPAPRTPMQVLEEAYLRLQAANSARYSISGLNVECGGQFVLTNYEVANYHFYGPRWVRLGGGRDGYYVVEHDYVIDYGFSHDPHAEFWGIGSGQWRKVPRDGPSQREILRRYRELSPHHALTTIFRGYDNVAVEITARSAGEMTLEAKFDPLGNYYPSAEIVIVLDEQSYEIREYSVNWPEGQCGMLELLAKDGQYGIDFEFPDAVMEGSRYLASCRPETLGPISGTIMLEGVVPGSCGTEPARNVRRYHFSLDSPRSMVNIFVHRHYLSLRLVEEKETPQRQGSSWEGPYSEDSWTGHVLPAGKYTIEIETYDPLVSMDFRLEITATPLVNRPASISSGYEYTCTLDAGGVPYCWGSDREGRASPPDAEGIESISSGAFHSCALHSEGSAVCWGANQYGQASPPEGEKFTAISSGGWGHTCALRADGSPACWGWNEYGQASPPQEERLTAISSGNFHTCALRTDGTPVCWGTHHDGRASPPTGERFTGIDSGGFHTCALRADGSPVCWGSDSEGQASPPKGERLTAISSGERHTCALREDGTAACWGDNKHAQSSPPEGKNFSAISSGHGHTSHTCGITREGSILCWGWGQ